MSVVELRPTGALGRYVSAIRYHASAARPFALERVLPSTARTHLIVNLHEDEFRTYDGDGVRRTAGAILAGPQSRSRVLDTAQMQRLIFVDFHAGGTSGFFAPPLDHARDALIDLGELWGREGAAVRERLLEAPTAASQLATVASILETRFEPADADAAVDGAVRWLRRGATVSAVASALDLSARTLSRRFRARIGMTPKRFARVCRLQRLLEAVPTRDPIDWSLLAVEHGYFDQSHLVNDFRDLTGLTPTEYVSSHTERNHVPVA